MIRQKIFYFALVVVILSCTGKETAKDKYPDIPLFPVSSSEKYVFEKTLFSGSVRLRNFIGMDNNGIWPPQDSIVLFDLTLAEQRVVYFEGDLQCFDEFSGGLITYTDNSTFLRYRAPNFIRELVAFKEFSGSYDSVKQKNPKQDVLKVRAISDSIDQAWLQRFSCVTELPDRQHHLLRS